MRSFLVAAIYCAAGRLALLMAIPPGYATAVWPAAGAALVFILLWGPRMAPAIFVGSFFVNAGTSFDASSSAALAESIGIAIGIGVGAAGQATVGALLIRKFVGFPTALEANHDIAKFIFLGGPLPCLLSPTIGVTTLCGLGVVPWANFAFNWWTWWIGDAIGVLIFAPLTLLFIPRLDPLWRRRRATVGVPLLVGFAVVTGLFLRASAWEETRLRTEFERRATPLAHALEARLSEYQGVVGFLSSLFEASPDVSRAQFREFCQRALRKYPGIQGLGWNPRVEDARRAEFEAAARRDGLSHFEITEQDPEGVLRRAAARAEYVPVYYLEPEEGNGPAVGFDIASEPDRLEALIRARDSGELSATSRVTLIQEIGGQQGVLLVAPVFAPARDGAPTRASRPLRGYVVGVFRIDHVMETAMKSVDHEGLDFRILDEDARDEDRTVYASRQTSAGPSRRAQNDHGVSSRRWRDSFDFGGRRWTLEVTASAAYLAVYRSWQSWMVLAGGLLFVGILGVMLLMATGRASQVQRTLAESSAEAIRAFQAEEKFRSTIEAASAGMLMADQTGKIVLVNAQVERLFGYAREELIGRSVEILVPAQSRGRHPAYRAKFFQEPEARPMGGGRELFGIRKDGSEVPVEIGLNPMRTADGDFVLGSIVDITARKMAEATLRESAERFRTLVDVSAQIVWTAGPSGEVVEDSPSWRAFTGQTYEQWRSGEWFEAFHPEDRDRVAALWESAIATKSAIDTEYRIRHVSGEWRWTAARAVPLLDGEGRVRGWIGMNSDITNRKRAEYERDQLLKELQNLNTQLEARVSARTADLSKALREREVLIQEIHHRVKNNLQVISSIINMQMRKLDADSNRDALEECQTRVQAIALIHEKLYQSKDYSRVPFSEYARSLAINVFEATGASLTSVTLDLAIEDLALAVDRAIPCGLVLNELITNALKHGFRDGRQGTIRVELAKLETGQLRMAVKDNGVGLPTDLDIRRSDSLGLQLICTLSEQLDAELEVNGGGGTSFQLTFAADGGGP
ncbi:CHASE domain-containing protein [Pendulispora albinea]|uniref:histidine kinase n=1 Tax=Pendulispora albinea TaxID=2741071 RepID=A0ABZ2LZJ4_9BACT